ncbi:hypothetical protein LBMAG20_15980 [Methylocystaceae bacterium]|nr:hypothetical protein LBMAG20_15980 [Methylocystaceae bacterium]
MKRIAHNFFYNAHKIIGLFLGLVFVLIGLSGSILAFREDIDERLNYSLMRVASPPNASFKIISEIYSSAIQAIPKDAKVERLMMPRHKNAAAILTYIVETDDLDSFFYEVFINPYTAKVTGQRLKIHGEDQFSQPIIQILMAFHWTLLLGANNAYLIGFIGIFFFFSAFAGLYLWWLKNKNWRLGLTVKWQASSERITYDLHKNIGFYGAAFLIIMTATGAAMIFKPVTQKVTSLFSTVSGEPNFGKSKPSAQHEPIHITQAIVIANRVFKDGKIFSISLPNSPTGVFIVGKMLDSEPNKSRTYRNVSIDQYSGEILQIQDPDNFTAGEKLFEWLFPVHTGEIFGEYGRPVLLLIGLLPLALFTTGLMRWRQKRHSRKIRS